MVTRYRPVALLRIRRAFEFLRSGDRHAVDGFSGIGRLRSELYRVKCFDEPYGAAVKGRIEAIEPRDYAGHLFGDVNYVVVDDVTKLPLRVPEVYRALTT